MNRVINFRPANIEDLEKLLHWRNDKTTRMNSINTDAVSIEQHSRWLKCALSDPYRKIFIAEIDGLPVGLIRFDRISDSCWELSWNVAPNFRGKGIGKWMVKQGAELNPHELIARIKLTNQASIKVAIFAGFVIEDQKDGMANFRLKK